MSRTTEQDIAEDAALRERRNLLATINGLWKEGWTVVRILQACQATLHQDEEARRVRRRGDEEAILVKRETK